MVKGLARFALRVQNLHRRNDADGAGKAPVFGKWEGLDYSAEKKFSWANRKSSNCLKKLTDFPAADRREGESSVVASSTVPVRGITSRPMSELRYSKLPMIWCRGEWTFSHRRIGQNTSNYRPLFQRMGTPKLEYRTPRRMRRLAYKTHYILSKEKFFFWRETSSKLGIGEQISIFHLF